MQISTDIVEKIPALEYCSAQECQYNASRYIIEGRVFIYLTFSIHHYSPTHMRELSIPVSG